MFGELEIRGELNVVNFESSGERFGYSGMGQVRNLRNRFHY